MSSARRLSLFSYNILSPQYMENMEDMDLTVVRPVRGHRDDQGTRASDIQGEGEQKDGLDDLEIRLSGLRSALALLWCCALLTWIAALEAYGRPSPFSSWWHWQRTHEVGGQKGHYEIPDQPWLHIPSTCSVGTARSPQMACKGYTPHGRSSEGVM